MDKKYTILSIVAGLVILVGIGSLVKTALEPVVPIEDHTKGADNALVTIVEYSDFQCGACRNQYPLLKRAAEDYKDEVKVVYKHFPLSGHHNAKAAAYAAEAAGMQGKFWEMHDKIFDEQALWSRLSTRQAKKSFVGYAGELGLDVDKFEDDMDSKSVKKKVNDDLLAGKELNVNSTPSIFINDQYLPQNPSAYGFYQETLDATLGKKAPESGEDSIELLGKDV